MCYYKPSAGAWADIRSYNPDTQLMAGFPGTGYGQILASPYKKLREV